MSVEFAHKGCTSPVWRFLPEGKPRPGLALRQRDWIPLAPQVDGRPMVLMCPDCREHVHLGSSYLTEIEPS